MSQDSDPRNRRPDGQPPSLHKGPEQYPQAPMPGQYPQSGEYPSAPGPVGYGPGSGQGGPPQKPKNGLGVAALVLGILSIPLGFFFFPVGILIGLLAVILGAVGYGRARKGRATNGGLALTGLITGIIGMVIGILIAAVYVPAYLDCADRLGSDATVSEITDCTADELAN